jgi:hypothetical protein
MARDLYGEMLGRALNRQAPPGHIPAYITPGEAQQLRARGGGVTPGGGQVMAGGVPAFPPPGAYAYAMGGRRSLPALPGVFSRPVPTMPSAQTPPVSPFYLGSVTPTMRVPRALPGFPSPVDPFADRAAREAVESASNLARVKERETAIALEAQALLAQGHITLEEAYRLVPKGVTIPASLADLTLTAENAIEPVSGATFLTARPTTPAGFATTPLDSRAEAAWSPRLSQQDRAAGRVMPYRPVHAPWRSSETVRLAGSTPAERRAAREQATATLPVEAAWRSSDAAAATRVPYAPLIEARPSVAPAATGVPYALSSAATPSVVAAVRGVPYDPLIEATPSVAAAVRGVPYDPLIEATPSVAAAARGVSLYPSPGTRIYDPPSDAFLGSAGPHTESGSRTGRVPQARGASLVGSPEQAAQAAMGAPYDRPLLAVPSVAAPSGSAQIGAARARMASDALQAQAVPSSPEINWAAPRWNLPDAVQAASLLPVGRKRQEANLLIIANTPEYWKGIGPERTLNEAGKAKLRMKISEGGAGRLSAVASIGDVGVTPGGLKALDYRTPEGGSVLSQPRPAPGIETERASEASQVAADIRPWLARILGAASFLPPPLGWPALASKLFAPDRGDQSDGDGGFLARILDARAGVGKRIGSTLSNIGSYLPPGEERKYEPLPSQLAARPPGIQPPPVQPFVSSDPSTWPYLPELTPTEPKRYALGPDPSGYPAYTDSIAARYAEHYAQGFGIDEEEARRRAQLGIA